MKKVTIAQLKKALIDLELQKKKVCEKVIEKAKKVKNYKDMMHIMEYSNDLYEKAMYFKNRLIKAATTYMLLNQKEMEKLFGEGELSVMQLTGDQLAKLASGDVSILEEAEEKTKEKKKIKYIG